MTIFSTIKKEIESGIRQFDFWIKTVFFPDFWYHQKYYGQHGEDAVLASFFPDWKTRKGFYVDIGAFHPFRYSNTAIFYKNGWQGINIEPNPDLQKNFQRHRKRDINLNFGVAKKSEVLTYYRFDVPALNSFDKNLSEERAQNTPFHLIETNKIQVFPLTEILENYLPENQTIDFLNIDVEGLDLEVLKSNDWKKYRPTYILAEWYLDGNDFTKNPIYSFLYKQEYELVGLTKLTGIFKNKRIN